MTMEHTQEQIEKALSDILPHGIREGIAKGTGIYPKIIDAYFNPYDERKSPHFTVLHIQAVIDALDPATGDALWQRMIEFLNNGEIDGSESHIQRELFGHDGKDAGRVR